MSDLLGNHVVGFPTRRLKYVEFELKVNKIKVQMNNGKSKPYFISRAGNMSEILHGYLMSCQMEKGFNVTLKVSHIEKTFNIMKACPCNTEIFSSPEPSGSQGELIVYPCSVVRPSSVRPSVVHHFQRSSSLKQLGQSKPNFT